MRLYLSSFRIGDSADQLIALMQGRKRACVVGNAVDFIPDEARREYEATVYDPKKEFAALGIDAYDIDLREYFDDQNGLSQALRHYDLVWVLGGNSFLLLRAMVQSGFDKVIRSKLAEDAIAYGGFSAGAVVATPTLRGIEQSNSTATWSPVRGRLFWVNDL